MAKLDSALWRDMMEYLRRRHSPICRQWFEELQPLSLDAGLLKIYTPSSVQQNYLQRKCLEQFTEAAQSVTSALVAVRFVNTREAVPQVAGLPVASGATVAIAQERASHSSSTGSAGHGNGNGRTAAAFNVAARPSAPPRHQIANGGESGSIAHHIDQQIVLSPDYCFENFVTGPGNQLAAAAAVAVADQPGSAYNPLFVHGGCGLGKTHLLQAICQRIMQKHQHLRLCYLSCETFMNQFIDSVQRGQMSEFRHHYRHIDVLLIDDIHYLANKDRSQEEFFHTFNELYQSNRQIVLSSDSPPNEIPQLEERLVSRFQWGLVTMVSKPCYETRVAIIRAKAKLRGLELPDDVVAYIATRIDSNARELEGAITTIQAHAALQNLKVTLPLAQTALGESVGDTRHSQVTLQNIIDAVTVYYNVKLSDLQSKRRHKSITMPRQVCMWLARKRTRFSLQEIGGYFGGRDHTTVMHSIETVDGRIRGDINFAQQISQLDGRIVKPS